jgi:putative membrane protein
MADPVANSEAAAASDGESGRTGMAAERTWLAWWRTALAATAGALAVGRVAPQLLHTARVPYVILGAGYAGLAVALLVVGARRHRELQRLADRGEPAPLPGRVVTGFTVAGVLLAVATVVLVVARS